MSKVEYTKEEYAEFRKLVLCSESRDQMHRINARLDMPRFVEKHGREKCDAMFAELNNKEPV